MGDIRIRKALASDADSLASFNIAMALETEEKKLDNDQVLAGILAVFESDQHGFYIVAENTDGNQIGGLMVTYEWSDWRNGFFWWIQSVYIVPKYRGLGIYREMYKYVKSLAGVYQNVCGFRLYVEKENEHAMKVYQACGMEKLNYVMYEEEVKSPE